MAIPQLCRGGLWLLWGQLGWETARSYWEPLLGASPGSAAANERAKAAIFSQNPPTAAGGRTATRSSHPEKWEVRQEPGARNVLDVEHELC